MSNEVVHVTDSSFKEVVLNSELPVLVDYWAEWCGPCKMISPILDEIALEYSDKIIIAKLNIDDAPETPQIYGVRGVPTLMIFNKGKIINTNIGVLTKPKLKDFISDNI